MITVCFKHYIFHDNLKENVYELAYSYKYCMLLPDRTLSQTFLLGEFRLYKFQELVSGAVIF